MNSEFQWSLVRNSNAFICKRNGISFSTEPGNVAMKHSYKFSALAQDGRSIRIKDAGAEGVMVSRSKTNVSASHPSKHISKGQIIKGSANAVSRANKLSKQMESTGFRLDIAEDAAKLVEALLRSKQARREAPARKLRLLRN